MSMKSVINVALRVIAVTLIYLIAYVAAVNVTIVPLTSELPAADTTASATALLLVALLNSLVLTYLIIRSRWSGWRLAAAIFVVFYGVNIFQTYIETAIFPGVAARMPPGMLAAAFGMGVLLATPLAPLAVLVLGKWKPAPATGEATKRLVMPAAEWVWKLALLAIAYMSLYLTFGYFVAWRNPAVPAYYGGTDPGTFAGQLASIIRDTPWLPFFQLFRGIVWVLIALPVIRMFKGAWWEAGLAVALLFSVIMNSALLLPNPVMPEAVRMAHLVETGSSNFIFGWIVAWLLHRHHNSLQDLFALPSAASRRGQAAA